MVVAAVVAMGATNAYNTSKGNEVSIILKNGRTRQTAKCTEKVDNLKVAIMDQFWDNGRGDFKDSPFNPTLYLQYANSMTIAFLVISPKSKQANRVSDDLANNRTPIGPICLELPRNV